MQISYKVARCLFRIAQVISFIPFIEFLSWRTGWSTVPIMMFYVYLIAFFRCQNCGVNLIDKRVVSKIGNKLDFLDHCPNCGEQMR
jgi:hypothetical protein